MRPSSAKTCGTNHLALGRSDRVPLKRFTRPIYAFFMKNNVFFNAENLNGDSTKKSVHSSGG
jgi:hypothetical protein